MFEPDDMGPPTLPDDHETPTGTPPVDPVAAYEAEPPPELNGKVAIILSETPEGIDDPYIYVTKAHAKELGYKPDKVTGRWTLEDALPQALQDRLQETLQDGGQGTGQGTPPIRVHTKPAGGFGGLNATSFQAGRSGNPAGRKKTMEVFHEWISRMAGKPCPFRPGMTYGQAAAHAVYDSAIVRHNMVAAKILFDRIDPAPLVNVTLNQFVVRSDLNERLDALKACDVDRLLPAEV